MHALKLDYPTAFYTAARLNKLTYILLGAVLSVEEKLKLFLGQPIIAQFDNWRNVTLLDNGNVT